jgi:hypothetical protein
VSLTNEPSWNSNRRQLLRDTPERNHFEDLSVNGIILKWTLRKRGGRVRGRSCSEQGQLMGFYEHGNEPSGPPPPKKENCLSTWAITGFLSGSQHGISYRTLFNTRSLVPVTLELEVLTAVMVKPIPVPGRGGPYGCERSRLPHFLDNQLREGGEAVSLTRRPAALYTQEDSWYLFR